MKFTIEKNDLLQSLNKIASVVERKNTIPILSHVCIVADSQGVTFKATDLDIEITNRATAKVESIGATTVNAALFLQIVAKLPNGSLVSVSLSDDIVTLKAGRSKFELSTLRIDDFPNFSESGYNSQFTTQSLEVKRLIDLSKGAVSTEETRYYLNGIYLHSSEGTLRAVATDGHRMAVVDSPIETTMEGVIVPRKTVAVMDKLLTDGECKISASQTKILFEIGDTVIASKVIDGTFPDYTRVVPQGLDRVLKANAKEFKAASDRVAVVADGKDRQVLLNITSDSLNLSVRGESVNGAQEDIDVTFDGDPITIGFNAKYIAEVLTLCSGSDVKIELSGAGNPIKVTSSDDEKAFFIVMPMRV